MTDLQQLELFVLRYVPNVVRAEFVNFGVILVKESNQVAGFRFTHDWPRIRCCNPNADIEALQAMQRHLEGELWRTPSWMESRRVFSSYISSGFELELPVAVLTHDVNAELNIISKIYLEPIRPIGTTVGRETGKSAIISVMDREFRQSGVLELLQRHASVASYTVPEDAYVIDYLYQLGDVVKMFQAIPVARTKDAAVNFAYRYPKIAAGLRRDQKYLEMTAVVEAAYDASDPSVACALHMLQELDIRVARTSEMRAIGEAARIDLRA